MTPEHWQRLKQLYEVAASLAPQPRQTLLQRVGAEDAVLRAELERMLAADADAAFLQTPALAHTVAAEPPRGALAGQRLGHYQMLEPLGAGAMGEVYLAHDLHLERRVALKVLPAEYTSEPERLQRFIREAKAASALNHPNIITIHEIGAEPVAGETLHYIATEFIAGDTLRARLAGGRLLLTEALDLMLQITAALAAAHEAGVIHRDIKPENVMVRPDGLVKVLDFGLAKLTEARGAAALESTGRGPIGTPRYMSPEQARGQHVDARTDIFSCGAVLYELLTGQFAFAGETAADVYAALLTDAPAPVTSYMPAVPAALEHIIGQALAKERDARYARMAELQSALQTVKTELAWPTAAAPRQLEATPDQRAPRQRWGLAASLLVLLFGGVLVWQYLLKPWLTPPPAINLADLRITVFINERLHTGGGLSGLAFAPDGKLVAYSLSDDEGQHLWIKQLEGGESKQVTTGPFQDYAPVWSQDGRQLAFLSSRSGKTALWVVPFMGGAPRLLLELEQRLSALAHWSADQRTIYYEFRQNFYALELATGKSTPLTQFDAQPLQLRYFSLSPDETQLAYREGGSGNWRIFVRPLRGGAAVPITPAETTISSLNWLPDGERLAYCFQRAGVYQIGMAWWHGGRAPQQLTFGNDSYTNVKVSPAGGRLLGETLKENANLFAYTLAAGTEKQQTTDFGLQLFPALTHGGALAFESLRSFASDEAIYFKLLDSGAARLLVERATQARWSPHAEALAFLRSTNGQTELWRASSGGGAEKRLATAISFGGAGQLPHNRFSTDFSWSPDGQRLAYSSRKSGAANLWVVGQDGAGEQQFTQNTAADRQLSSPSWAPDGQRLAYVVEVAGPARQQSIWLTGQAKALFQAESWARIIGWDAAGHTLYVAAGTRERPNFPHELRLFKVPDDGAPAAEWARLPAAYLHNLSLAPDGRSLAFVARQDGKTSINVIAPANGAIRKLTGSDDPLVYYSGLAWSPDGKTLVYSKQSSWSVVSLIENF